MTRLTVVLGAMLLSTGCSGVTSRAPGAVQTTTPRRSDGERAAAGKRSRKPLASVQGLREAMVSVSDARRVARAKEIAEWRKQCRAAARSANEAAACSDSPVLGETVTVNAAGGVASI